MMLSATGVAPMNSFHVSGPLNIFLWIYCAVLCLKGVALWVWINISAVLQSIVLICMVLFISKILVFHSVSQSVHSLYDCPLNGVTTCIIAVSTGRDHGTRRKSSRPRRDVKISRRVKMWWMTMLCVCYAIVLSFHLKMKEHFNWV